MAKQRLRVLPLGGLGQIGKNMMVLEYGNNILVVDAGVMFPREEHLGVDLIIPDISYLEENRDKVRGIVITHGHEDHIGALPYVLPRLNVPVYCSRLTHGLISVKLEEHHLLKEAKLEIVEPGDEVRLGPFWVQFFWVNHSIPDAMGLIIHTPLGIVVHSGDFKIDFTPVDGRPADLARLANLGEEGVFLLFSDSTYVEIPGYTPSEKVVGESLDRIIGEAKGRVIIATFASLISRVQQIIDAAAHHGRFVFTVGRSMVDNVRMALELGYLSVPEGILARPSQLRRLPPEQIVIIATGTQGEPTSALTRIANRDHRQIHITPGDTVVLSASPIPGNEGLVNRTIDNLFKQGAEVHYHQRTNDVHVHGHASQEELKLILGLVRPKFFIPVHGEYRHLQLHAELAQSMGVPESNVFVLENGQLLELGPDSGRVVSRGLSGNVYVDGLSVGDIGQVVLRDRRTLSEEGVVIVVVAVDLQMGQVVGEPDVVSRGFVDMREQEALINRTRKLVMSALDHGGERLAEPGFVASKVRDTLGSFFYQETRRRPMILPVIVEV